MTVDVQTVKSTAETLAALARPAGRARPVKSNLQLTRQLAVASFKLKYAGSALGYVWSLMRPLLLFGMLYLVFALFLLRGRTAAGENFPVELLVGIVAWTFFAEATATSVSSVVANADMLKKARFPRSILVVSSVLSAVMTLTVNFALVLILGLIFGWYAIGWQTLMVPVLLLELILLATGAGLLLGAVFVYFRDIGYTWEIALQLLFYASAIIFPLTLVPAAYRWIVVVNPVAQAVEDLRRALVSAAVPWSTDLLGARLIIPLGIVMLALVVGATVFARLSGRFGDHL